MIGLWEYGSINIKKLGDMLLLDSGTLTPLLKKLETKGYISRNRDSKDERNLIISITKEGNKLKEKAVCVPTEIGKCINLSEKETMDLYKLLYKLLGNMEKDD